MPLNTATPSARRISEPAPVALTQALSLVHLRDDDLDGFVQASPAQYVAAFAYLSAPLIDILLPWSEEAPLVYIETDYSGGKGMQGALCCDDGKVVYGPARAVHGPVNEALAWLGVGTGEGSEDAFEALGLGRHRHTEDWVEAGQA